MHETVPPCLLRNNTSSFPQRSRLSRIISAPALPNPTRNRFPIRCMVDMRKWVSIPTHDCNERSESQHSPKLRKQTKQEWTLPLNISLVQYHPSAVPSPSLTKALYSGESLYPRGSFINIESSLTILSIGSTTCVEMDIFSEEKNEDNHRFRMEIAATSDSTYEIYDRSTK
jgi:hypothetical protein